jgi:hypothetical protein
VLEIASGCLIISKMGSPYSTNEEFEMGICDVDAASGLIWSHPVDAILKFKLGERESFRATAI